MNESYNTVNTQADHYHNGYFSVGTGPHVVIILGSCRVVPYLNMLNLLNKDNRFTLVLINVVNFYNEPDGTPVNPKISTARYEKNPALLDMLKRCKWFIHEYTENFGMFNTSHECVNNIHNYGLYPEFDLSIPNFNNTFILFQELVNYDNDIRESVKIKGMTPALQEMIKLRGLAAVDKFLNICALTSLPEFGSLFRDTWRNVRYFWSGNHISNHFTANVFRLLNERFLKLELTPEFWEAVMGEDMYKTPCEPITSYDVENYGLTWPQPIEELKIP